jgi:hypothetical protein
MKGLFLGNKYGFGIPEGRNPNKQIPNSREYNP